MLPEPEANDKLSLPEFPHRVDLTLFEQPALYESWIREKSTLSKREIASLFQWDVRDKKAQDNESGFNEYVLSLFHADLADGWSLSEKIDPLKLLPLELMEFRKIFT